jgi:hypothetical protein
VSLDCRAGCSFLSLPAISESLSISAWNLLIDKRVCLDVSYSSIPSQRCNSPARNSNVGLPQFITRDWGAPSLDTRKPRLRLALL